MHGVEAASAEQRADVTRQQGEGDAAGDDPIPARAQAYVSTVMRLSSHVWRVRAWYLYARERSRRSAMVAADVGSEKVLVPVPVQFVIVCDGRGIGSGIGYAQK